MTAKDRTDGVRTNAGNPVEAASARRSADEILADLERTKFAGLKVDPSKRTRFSGSATVIEQEVKDFVESLDAAFQEDPDWWYPIGLGSKVDLDKAIDQARTYARGRKPRLTISIRRRPEDPDGMAWFRASGYTARHRS